MEALQSHAFASCEHDLAEVHEKFNPTHFIRLESIGPLHLRFQDQVMVHTPLQSALNSVTRSVSGENKYKQEAVHTLSRVNQSTAGCIFFAAGWLASCI